MFSIELWVVVQTLKSGSTIQHVVWSEEQRDQMLQALPTATNPTAMRYAADLCWHCKDCLEATLPHCERCPEECDGNCSEEECSVRQGLESEACLLGAPAPRPKRRPGKAGPASSSGHYARST
jgi:hypothetical protein